MEDQKMNKLYAILLMALLVVSMVPAVIAESGSSDDSDVRAMDDAVVEDADETERSPVGELRETYKEAEERREERREAQREQINARKDGREEVKERFDEHKEERLQAAENKQARLKNRAERLISKAAFKNFKEENFKARKLTKERVKLARENAKDASDRAKAAREKFNELKEKVKDRAEELRTCKSDDSEECEVKRTEAKADAIEALQKAAESASEEIAKLKARIEESESLSEEEVKALLVKITSAEEKLDRVNEEIDGLDESSTKDEIKTAARHLRQVLANVKDGLKNSAGKLVHARMGGVIARSRSLQDNLNRVLDRAEGAGKDVSAVSDLVEQFNTQLDKAQTAYEKATESWKTDDVEIAKGLAKESQDALKEAHETLKDIFHQLKEHKLTKDLKEVEDDEDDNSEVELEDEESEDLSDEDAE